VKDEIDARHQAALRNSAKYREQSRRAIQACLTTLGRIIQDLDHEASRGVDPEVFLDLTRRGHAILGKLRQIVARRPETDEDAGPLVAPSLRGMSPAVRELSRAYDALLLVLCTRGFRLSEQKT
jgi:hypothetical protein